MTTKTDSKQSTGLGWKIALGAFALLAAAAVATVKLAGEPDTAPAR